MRMNNKLRDEADVFIRNQRFLTTLRNLHRTGQITRQQLLTLRGQALKGDEEGARKGLVKVLEG